MFADAIADIAVPTLVLWGTADRWIHPANATCFKHAIPDCTVITYDGAGHGLMDEPRERTVHGVRTFLADR